MQYRVQCIPTQTVLYSTHYSTLLYTRSHLAPLYSAPYTVVELDPLPPHPQQLATTTSSPLPTHPHRRRFPGRMLLTERHCASERCDFRDCTGMRYSLIDLMNLARTRLILGSGTLLAS